MERETTRRLIFTAVAIGAVGTSILIYQKLRPGAASPLPAGPIYQPQNPTVDLMGIVRDFTPSHPDFEVGAGAGHIAGSVSQTLNDRNRPDYVGEGYKVTTQWMDDAGNPIAPHTYNTFNVLGMCFVIPGIAVDGRVELNNQARVDSYDSSVGPYGGSNIGSDALISTNSIDSQIVSHRNSSEVYGTIMGGPGGNANDFYTDSPPVVLTGELTTLEYEVPMPVIYEPRNMGSSSGDFILGPGEHTISSNLHVDKFTVKRGARLIIENNVTIFAEGDVLLEGSSSPDFARVSLAPGASLQLYTRGNIALFGELNKVSSQPERCVIYKTTTGTITAELNQTQVAARIIAPDSTLNMRQGAEIYGTFVGRGIVMDNNAKFHVDSSLSGKMSMPSDTEGAAGSSATGGVTSASTFNQWFNDSPGVNMSAVHTIQLVQNGGVWEYLDDAFTPINDDLLGNESGSTNSFLTYVVNARFDYQPCTGQFIEFDGDDDMWMYINGKLVMDRGGIAPGARQFVDVDRLGLDPDQSHSLMMFYAQRRGISADKRFRLRTNLLLSTAEVRPTVNGSYD